MLLIAFCLLTSDRLLAQVPGTLSYQGVLLSSDGITPLTGSQNLEFRFFDAVSDGNELAVAARTLTITPEKGLFTCVIGGGSGGNAPLNSTEIEALSAQTSYIQIKVGSTILSPRAQLTPAAYAFQAQSAYTIKNDPDFYWDATNHRLGIGTQVPSTRIHVAGSGAFSGDDDIVAESFSTSNPSLQLRKSQGTLIAPSAVLANDLLGRVSFQGYQNSTTSAVAADIRSSAETDFSTAVNGNLYFRTTANGTGSERMRITSSGNIGIGTTTPSYKLDVNGEIASRSTNSFRLRGTSYSTILRNDGTDFYILSTANGAPDGTWNSFRPFIYNYATGALTMNGLTVLSNGNLGMGTTSPQNKLDVEGGAVVGAAYSGSAVAPSNGLLVQGNAVIGSTINTTSSMEITSFNSAAGTASSESLVKLTAGSGTPGSKSYVLRFTRGYNAAPFFSSTENFYIEDEGGADIIAINNRTVLRPGSDNTMSLGNGSFRWTTIYATTGTINTSDVRLKESVNMLKYGLSEVMRLRPVSFLWKDKVDQKINLGFIAQEVERITPEVVDVPKNDNEFYGLNYSQLVPVLVKAIQEQQSQIEDLKLKNDDLQKRLENVESFIQRRYQLTTGAFSKAEK